HGLVRLCQESSMFEEARGQQLTYEACVAQPGTEVPATGAEEIDLWHVPPWAWPSSVPVIRSGARAEPATATPTPTESCLTPMRVERIVTRWVSAAARPRCAAGRPSRRGSSSAAR